MKTKVETENAPKATGPYSQAIISGNFIFTSGQVYLTTEGKLLDGSIELCDRYGKLWKNKRGLW